MGNRNIVSLFSGCGGMDLGFMGGFSFLGKEYDRLPTQMIFANDICEAACKVYHRNLRHKPHCLDITAPSGRNLLPQKADIVIGGFPCQPFSVAGKREGTKCLDGNLYWDMANAVKRTQPHVFVAENVLGILSMDGVMDKIVSEFEEAGYFLSVQKVNAADYGVPQNRRRVLIIGAKDAGFFNKFSLTERNRKKISARAAIGDLENVEWGGVDSHTWSKAKRTNGQGNNNIKPDAPAPTIRAEHHGNIEFHYNGKRRLSVRECARLQSFPDDFSFGGESQTAAYKMIGNAVPPVLAWELAKEVINNDGH